MRAAALKHMWVELDGQRVTRVKDLPKKYHQFVDRHMERVSALQRARERWTVAGIHQVLPFSSFTGTVMIYTSGTSTNTVPFDSSHMTMEGWGGGGGGDGGVSVGTGGGGGGGAGGYTRTSNFSIAGNGGKTFIVVVGPGGGGGTAGNPPHGVNAGGSTTVNAGSVTGWNNVTCGGGNPGLGGSPGVGGSVTNTNSGSTNTTGATGTGASGGTGGAGAAGHAGGIGGDGGPYGGGGSGGNTNSSGSNGTHGAVVFSYVP